MAQLDDPKARKERAFDLRMQQRLARITNRLRRAVFAGLDLTQFLEGDGVVTPPRPGKPGRSAG
jgi:hypothetical protein